MKNLLNILAQKRFVLKNENIMCDICHIAKIYVVIKPEFSKFPKKIKVWSLSSSRCKFFRKCRLRILEEK